MLRRPIICHAAIAALLLVGCGGSDGPGRAGGGPGGPGMARATVTGPIGTAGVRGHALWDSWYDLGGVGYTEDEYFVAGTAVAHPTGAEAPYTTRIIVRRPLDPAHFNGTVLLDWVNVTAQFENAVDTLESHPFFHREGYAYVHVSAQSAGICCIPLTPKTWDPVRYAALSHPGDEYSFDMLTQIAEVLKAPGEVDAMAGLPVQRVIAMGQSQSASRLYDYVTDAHPQAGPIDGFLIHSGGGREYAVPPSAPVLQLFSEAEAEVLDPSVIANYRSWEIAGAAHQDFWVGYHQVIGQGGRATASLPQQPSAADETLHATAGNYGEQVHPLSLVCIVAGTQFPMRYSVNAAIHHLDQWIRTGAAPPVGARYQFDGSGGLARDSFNNGLGGIRLPPVEVPVARYVSDICVLGGVTIPLTDPELAMLYPTHADYYCAMRAATDRSVADGFLLPEDGADLMERVENAGNRWAEAGTRTCE